MKVEDDDEVSKTYDIITGKHCEEEVLALIGIFLRHRAINVTEKERTSTGLSKECLIKKDKRF